MSVPQIEITAVALKTYDFSWQRSTRLFRFRAAGDEVIAKSIEGYASIEAADGHTGRMELRCRLELLDSGHVNIWLDPGDVPEPDVPESTDYAETWQLCFFRREEKWRIWDKANRAATLEIVDGYRGPAYISWPAADQGGHIFVHGRKWTDDGLVRFAGDKP